MKPGKTTPETPETSELNQKLIELAQAANYEFIREYPRGRLLFWDPLYEIEIQFWKNGAEGFDRPDNDFKRFMTLILNRNAEHNRRLGRTEVQSDIKKALGL